MNGIQDTTKNIAVFQEGVEFQKDEMDKLVPFSDLIELADYVFEKVNCHISIRAIYDCYSQGESAMKYVLYIAGDDHEYFDTVQELKEAMERIISPVEDQGVLLEKEAA